jgi:hypothetical protein
MQPKIGLWALLLGLLAAAWLITVLFFGWGAASLPKILLAAGAIWLAGAALVTAGKGSRSSLWLAVGLLVLAALVLVPPIFFEHEPWGQPAILQNTMIGFLLSQLLPALALIAAAMLLSTSLRQIARRAEPGGGAPAGGKTALTAFSLAGLLLAGGFYHLYWLFVWDSTYDSLDFFFLIVPILAALFAAALLAELLEGKWQLSGLLYAVLIPAVLILVYRSAKQVDYRALTERRAGQISQALESYHARRGSYPVSLDQLRPWTMPAIPAPVILHGQDWCYQSEQDAYRLGFVDREHWSSPELFATAAQARGTPANQEGLCAAEIAQMEASYPDFYGFKR